MGCDGGMIPTRGELVKMKKKPEQLDKEQLDHSKWSLCKISQSLLSEPIVIDDLGNLFNKDAVIQSLLESTIPSSFSHIKSMKSIYPVHFSPNPAHEKNKSVAPWYCPITKIEVGGHHKFNYLKPCGHVLSEKSFKELSSSNNNNSNTSNDKEHKNSSSISSCFLCSKVFKMDEDIIIINPSEDELSIMKANLQSKKNNNNTKKEKREKKSKKKETNNVNNNSDHKSSSTDNTTTTTTTTTSSTNRKRTLDNLNETSNSSKTNKLVSENGFTTSTIAKANEELSKKMKSETFASIFKTSTTPVTNK
eukprot:gene2631-3268_t